MDLNFKFEVNLKSKEVNFWFNNYKFGKVFKNIPDIIVPCVFGLNGMVFSTKLLTPPNVRKEMLLKS